MYNVTPARTNRGRKKTKTVETTVITTVHVHETQSAEEKKSSEEPKEKEQENQSFVQSSGEEKSSKEPKETVDRNQQTEAKKNSEKLTGEKTENISTKSVQKQNPSTSEKKNLQIVEKTAQQCSNTEKEIPDRGAEALDLELRKCASTTADHKVKQLLKVTLDLRNSLAIEIPKNSRVEEMLSKYPVFKGPKPLIANLMLNLAGNLKEEELAENVHQCSQVILDLLFAKDLCTFSRSALKTEGK
ncbi:uncharacterized protein LOC134252465 [Saccostrea cucullata]|uniref:uncharacterized protein LOC134252465 n=1 Tax=Saccostrea cuccullata TaxID=36930 RepID=UPI002ED48FDD